MRVRKKGDGAVKCTCTLSTACVVKVGKKWRMIVKNEEIMSPLDKDILKLQKLKDLFVKRIRNM